MTDPDSELPSTSSVQLESEMDDAETEQIDQLQQPGEVLSQTVLESMHTAVLSANRYSSIRMPDEDQFISILDQAIKVVQTGAFIISSSNSIEKRNNFPDMYIMRKIEFSQQNSKKKLKEIANSFINISERS